MLVSMYSNINAQIEIDTKLSHSIACNIGLKQGDLSSQIIVNIYLNELCSSLKEKCSNGIFITNDIPNIYCLMFADDVANFAETAYNLQKQLNIIEHFCTDKNMVVNLKR